MGVLRKGHGAPTWPKNAIMALISELLSADLSTHLSSDTLAIIYNSRIKLMTRLTMEFVRPL